MKPMGSQERPPARGLARQVWQAAKDPELAGNLRRKAHAFYAHEHATRTLRKIHRLESVPDTLPQFADAARKLRTVYGLGDLPTSDPEAHARVKRDVLGQLEQPDENAPSPHVPAEPVSDAGPWLAADNEPQAGFDPLAAANTAAGGYFPVAYPTDIHPPKRTGVGDLVRGAVAGIRARLSPSKPEAPAVPASPASPSPGGLPKAPLSTANEDARMLRPSSERVSLSPGNMVLKELRDRKAQGGGPLGLDDEPSPSDEGPTWARGPTPEEAKALKERLETAAKSMLQGPDGVFKCPTCHFRSDAPMPHNCEQVRTRHSGWTTKRLGLRMSDSPVTIAGPGDELAELDTNEGTIHAPSSPHNVSSSAGSQGRLPTAEEGLQAYQAQGFKPTNFKPIKWRKSFGASNEPDPSIPSSQRTNQTMQLSPGRQVLEELRQQKVVRQRMERAKNPMPQY